MKHLFFMGLAIILLGLMSGANASNLSAFSAPLHHHVATPALKFEHINPRQGLHQNTVTSLFRDRAGLMWIGTQDGLHTYNGKKFHLFAHDIDDPTTISGSIVTAITQDKQGSIWVGTYNQGLNKLNLKTGKFTRYNQADGLTDLRIHSLSFVGDTLWVGTETGLFSFSSRINNLTKVPLGNSFAPNITSLAAIGNDLLIVGTQSNGIFSIDSSTISPINLPQNLPAHQIRVKDGNTIVVSLANQLWQYNLSTRVGEMIWERPLKQNNHHEISDFVISPDDNIWLVGASSGLIKLDLQAKNEHLKPPSAANALPLQQIKTHTYQYDPLVQSSIIDNEIVSLLLDPNGLLWLGTRYSGLNKVSIEPPYFQYLYEDSPKNPRQSNNIRALFRDKNKALWIGTDGGGIKKLRLDNQSYQHYSHYFTNAASIVDPDMSLRIFDIVQDRHDSLWMASNLGLGKLEADGTFSLYQQNDIQMGALGNGLIRSLHIDDSDRLWIGLDSRLFKYQPTDDSFHEIPLTQITHFDALQSNIMVIRSEADNLWLGTLNGLIHWDSTVDEGELFVHTSEPSQSIANNKVRDILISKDGSLWLASHGGLTQITKVEGRRQYSHYDEELGVNSSTIYALLEDDQGRIWFSSNAGISCFSPSSKQVITFDESDGLQGLEFNGKVKWQDDDGLLWFGGIKGINHFDPKYLPKNKNDIKLALTGYSIAGNYQRILDLSSPPAITMQYSDQVISFDVVSLDFGQENKDSFSFQLLGLENHWRSSDTSNDITYTNLTPGNYTLKVRYGLQNDSLGRRILSVPLEVSAPVYRSNYAYAFYAFLFLLIVAKAIGDRRVKRQQQYEFDSSIKISEERLKLALWASGDGMWDWNISQDRVFRTGLNNENTYKETGVSLIDNIHVDDKPKVKLALSDHLKGRTPFYESEHQYLDETGEWIWVLERGKIVEFDELGQPVRMTGTQKNITSRKTAENELRLSSQVLQSMNEAVVVAGLDYKMLSVNPAFTLVTGFSFDEVMNKPFLYLTRGQQTRTFYQTVEMQLLHNKRWSGEITILTKGKRKILVWLEINQVIDTKGEASHFVAVFTDITDRKKAEEDLRVLANFDTLTGLPNRTLFQDRLSHAIHQAQRSKNIVALLFIDLDRFKHINDSMGHHVGDLLLKAVANRLKNSVREGDTVARLGGDEFTIILEGVSKHKVATIISEKLIHSFQTPFLLDDKILTTSPSIGISIYPEDAQDSSSLIKYADTAMYHAKSLGRNNFQFYTPKLNEIAVRHVELEMGLKQAIHRNELYLVYQPKFCVSSGHLTGLEALLRWQNPQLGSISPAEFIPLAEEMGMINQIGNWVINHACSQIAHWHELGFTSLNIAVNLSADQLKADIISTIEVALAVSGLPAHALELELTESMIMKKPQDSVSVLNQLKTLGLTLAIDDFGTGYSSLSYLKRFPIDTLKIDQEFVGDITDDPDDAAITSAIIALGHSLDLKVVAEGVETQEQLNFLAQHNCDQIQGYLLSKPLNAADCQAFLHQQKTTANAATGINEDH